MSLTFRNAPRISKQQFRSVLEKYGSPCSSIGDECFDIVAQSGLDPAVALAFFGHESVFGTRGVAVETLNWGNVRTPVDASRTVGVHAQNFAIFRNWQDGLRDWCDRINTRYIEQRGLLTVQQAIPVYAPSSDGNTPHHYINHVVELVDRWIAEDSGRQPDGAVDAQLGEALLRETFAAAGAQYHPEQAFHQYALSELRAGRTLGSPLGEQRSLNVGGQEYVLQVFALDTIYSPVPRWDQVKRLSELLKG